jgi:hypothetical protein
MVPRIWLWVVKHGELIRIASGDSSTSLKHSLLMIVVDSIMVSLMNSSSRILE